MSVKRTFPLILFITSAFLAGIFFATMGSNIFSDGEGTSVSHAGSYTAYDGGTTALPDTDISSAVTLEDAFTQVAESVNPAVVQIRSERTVSQRQGFEGTPFEDFFGPFNNPDRDMRSEGLGSGVLASEDGYIITNNHVIDGADALEVRLYDGEFFDAEVIGTDPLSDLAVIKIDAQELPSISYGSIENVRVGQWVMAFGSPLSQDLGNTATVGIVSALGRTSETISRLNLFSSFIQTDAAINPGNSGGPLVDLRGRLVGINSAIYSRSGGYQGIGFAIPVDVVENVATQLITDGTVRRGFLGVSFGPVSETLAEALDVPRGAAQVTSVTEGSAAERARLQENDIIVAVEGQPLLDHNQLRTIIANKRPGEDVTMEIVRNNEEMSVTVTLGERELDEVADAREVPSDDRGDSMEPLGLLRLETVNQDILAELGMEEGNTRGVIIVEIDRNGPAYREAELRRGDIIVEIDRTAVENRSAFLRVYQSIESGDSFLVRVMRPQNGGLVSFLTALEKP